MLVNQRLKDFIDFKKVSTTSLARVAGCSKQVASSWFARNVKIQGEYIINVIVAFTDLNARWLITGQGEMLEDQKKTPNEDELMEYGGILLDRLLEEKGKAGALENEIKHLMAEIDRLKQKCGEQDQPKSRAG